ncbi:MAG: hypothetical protein KDD05_04465 [Psychroserpens sp.]|nr:hypothetical protein [Psychroserpens sp.]
MIRRFYIIAFTLLSLYSYGQNIIFQPNINHKAQILKQNLNLTQDSLLLESKKTIKQVDIFNNDFLKSITVDSTKTAIALNKLPIGKFIIKARIDRKRIVMYLEKRSHNDKIIASTPKSKTQDTEHTSSTQSISEISKDNNSLYWVVYESNNGFGSHKSMSLKNIEDVNKMITQIKLEVQSKVGKNNKLLVYEIYNRSKFMTKQLRNHNYYKTHKSRFFNVIPIYDSLKETKNKKIKISS